MCGIAGMVAMQGTLNPTLASSLRAMTDAMHRRGPDADGFHHDAYAALGHRRLAIIDVTRGHQPMCNEDGTVWIVFNGEVYNHHEVRKDLLARGHVFKTHSDTEAIIHAYEEWGPACVSRLEGMFAFAVWDQKTRELLLARDRLGKKPVFYATLGGALHFASEIKAMQRSPAWRDDINHEAIEGYLNLGYILAPQSIYTHVHKLMPGHLLVLRDGNIRIEQYWDVKEFDSDPRQEGALLEELEHTLRQAVRERLESEVPLGAFLSSGVDSGLVVSFMAEVLGENILTATVGFGETGHNEIPGASLVAKQFRTRHQTRVIEPRLDEVFDEIVQAFDEPFADDSAIPTYYVSKIARQHVTVALTGDGGDEAWGGYDFRYLPHAWECGVRGMIPRGLSPLLRMLGRYWPRSSSLPKQLRLGTILHNLGGSADEAFFSDMCFVKPVDAADLMGRRGPRDPRDSAVFTRAVEAYSRCPSTDPLQKAMYGDLKTYLPNMPLVKVDRISMWHSLEIRCPLLDRKVIELAFRIPAASKMPQRHAKHLLKALAGRRLPAELQKLPKKGFSAPIGEWISGPFASQFESEVLSANSWVSTCLDRKKLRQIFDDHRAGVHRGWPLWAVWNLERWKTHQSRSAVASASALTPAGAKVN